MLIRSAALVLGCATLASADITLDSLLKEMLDRGAVARFPDPAYTCAQSSSYDRASTTPKNRDTWFANNDYNQFLRVDESRGRKEWVLADLAGPGAVVRIWSPNPKGTLRVYIDADAAPALEAPMADALGGKTFAPPLSQELSKGWNLYLPIPYAKHCLITSDSDGFYYQVNSRTYPAGSVVQSLTPATLKAAAPAIAAANASLAAPFDDHKFVPMPRSLTQGERFTIELPPGPKAVTTLQIKANASNPEQALRSLVLLGEFDGEPCIAVPFSDFFGSGVGVNAFRDWYRSVASDGAMTCRFVMPYQRDARFTIINANDSPAMVSLDTAVQDWTWDDRSMHFHATWNSEFPIHTRKANGTRDYNYLTVSGRGVYVGDNLAVMNPVDEWWGEGDEKIYVDGESFPSHFGTGTEDYYGYGWCCPVVFQHPFHSQPRCDGQPKANNRGHTTVTRVRSLDAIPFTKDFRLDMEVWHWAECDVAYASTAYWYASPGSVCASLSVRNIASILAGAAEPVPQAPPPPPPFVIDGAIECETMEIVDKSKDLVVTPQDLIPFGRGLWSNESHLWVQGRQPGDFVKIRFFPDDDRPKRVILHATKSWDYGIISINANGRRLPDIDLCSLQRGKALPSGPIDLGVIQPVDGHITLRIEVVGANPASEGTKSFFGLDCVILAEP